MAILAIIWEPYIGSFFKAWQETIIPLFKIDDNFIPPKNFISKLIISKEIIFHIRKKVNHQNSSFFGVLSQLMDI
jgi:hypothetical protein